MIVPRFLLNNLILVDVFFLAVLPLLALLLIWRFAGRSWKSLVKGFLAALLLSGIFAYGRFVESRQFTVRHVELSFKDLPQAFDGYRIVQVSDLHAGTLSADMVSNIVDSINALHPQLIVLTGDLQNTNSAELTPLLPLLQRLKAPDGIFSVLGNHDYGDYSTFYDNDFERTLDIARLVGTQQDLGWIVLMNGHRYLRRGDSRIVVAGMENDGDGHFPAKGDIGRALQGVSRNDFVIMLEHDPTSWRRKILPRCHAQLTLSGHTHGGQMSLFGWSPASLKYREVGGLYRNGNRCLFVTTGIGGGIPVRLGVKPEIVEITLRKQ